MFAEVTRQVTRRRVACQCCTSRVALGYFKFLEEILSWSGSSSPFKFHKEFQKKSPNFKLPVLSSTRSVLSMLASTSFHLPCGYLLEARSEIEEAGKALQNPSMWSLWWKWLSNMSNICHQSIWKHARFRGDIVLHRWVLGYSNYVHVIRKKIYNWILRELHFSVGKRLTFNRSRYASNTKKYATRWCCDITFLIAHIETSNRVSTNDRKKREHQVKEGKRKKAKKAKKNPQWKSSTPASLALTL